MEDRSGIGKGNRVLLDKLHQLVKGPFTPADAATLLSVDPGRARRLLNLLSRHGWLSRVRRGLYVLVPLGASEPKAWREDPWAVAATAFAPCYVSGWSACEHWGLTDQIFSDVVVVSAASLRHRSVLLQGTMFRLKYAPLVKHFGTRPAWRGMTRVEVADPTKAVVDILDDPSLGGGVKHVAEVVDTYFAGEHRSDKTLLDYVERLGNRTVYKRLGHILEAIGIQAEGVVEVCGKNLSAGLSLLDPTGPKGGRIQKKWRLRVNVELSRRSPS